MAVSHRESRALVSASHLRIFRSGIRSSTLCASSCMSLATLALLPPSKLEVFLVGVGIHGVFFAGRDMLSPRLASGHHVLFSAPALRAREEISVHREPDDGSCCLCRCVLPSTPAEDSFFFLALRIMPEPETSQDA